MASGKCPWWVGLTTDELIVKANGWRMRVRELEGALPAWMYDKKTGKLHIDTSNVQRVHQRLLDAIERAQAQVSEIIEQKALIERLEDMIREHSCGPVQEKHGWECPMCAYLEEKRGQNENRNPTMRPLPRRDTEGREEAVSDGVLGDGSESKLQAIFRRSLSAVRRGLHGKHSEVKGMKSWKDSCCLLHPTLLERLKNPMAKEKAVVKPFAMKVYEATWVHEDEYFIGSDELIQKIIDVEKTFGGEVARSVLLKITEKVEDENDTA